MTTRLSASSIRMYSECGKKFNFHYNQKLRSRVISGALLFGSAIDQALNYLLLNQQDLPGAISTFEKMWAAQNINGKLEVLSTSNLVVYADKDFDGDLLTEVDRNTFSDKFGIRSEYQKIEHGIDALKDKKAEKGFENLQEWEKEYLALAHWLCLRRKGLIMLSSYKKEALPKIKEVLTVQKNFTIGNIEGDSIIGYADLIVTLQNGENYLLDNKTSSRPYKNDSAKKSPQLVLYYHALKEEYNLKGVGFIVLNKAIKKNKVKICTKCNFNGSETRHKTCNNEVLSDKNELTNDNLVPKKVRCNGEFTETIFPECDIDVILNTVPQSVEDLVMETFDKVNDGINKEVFTPNLLACGDSDSAYKCQFSKLCWSGKDNDLIKLEDKK